MKFVHAKYIFCTTRFSRKKERLSLTSTTGAVAVCGGGGPMHAAEQSGSRYDWASARVSDDGGSTDARFVKDLERTPDSR